ncbi:MAG: phasin family protein [Rhizobacter sp.]|jgi:poly(hydroxyalkanoate) granule-associated protein
MVKKTDNPDFVNTVRDSAQQIWLAGLGAFAKAQAEGSKVFESLVKEGSTVQRKTQAAAEEKFGDVGARMSGMAGEMGAKATQQWDKLESIFEDRTARALERLGVPTARYVQALEARLAALEGVVAALGEAKAAPEAAAKRAASKRTPVKRSAARSETAATPRKTPVRKRSV